MILKEVGNSVEITGFFCALFYMVVFVEWFRRFRVKTQNTLLNYAYLVVILGVFVLGIWYSNLLADTYY